MASISNFISTVQREGLARSSRYTVNITQPASFSYGSLDLRVVTMYCSDVTLPGMTLTTAQLRTFGELRETPYDRVYDNVNMTFYVDTHMTVKEYFDKWINSIQNIETRTFAYYEKYVTPISIDVEDINDKARYRVKLHECYPKNIGSIQLAHDQKDVMKLQVSMNYKWWEFERIEETEEEQ